MFQAFDGKLRIGHAKNGIQFAGVELDRVVFVRAGGSAEAADVADVKLFRLPGMQAFFDLFGKAVGIGGRAKSFFGENGRGLMMAMAVAVGARETRDENVRAELAD